MKTIEEQSHELIKAHILDPNNSPLPLEQQEELDTFEKRVLEIPEVMECYLMSGDYDYLLRVVVADAADYERIHHQHLTRLPGIAKVRSSFALRTVTKAQELPIKH